ncbi:hypothetical protein RB195_008621 [Necator americanus]|uniref:G-protein coupled receptors family 1 profile domain-containing protein n=1 Tax=Necator americanus TaxID=51031 RepID=A0ABR1CS41_NECAM
MLQCRDDPPLFNLDDNATVEFFQGLQAFSEIYTILHRYLCLVLCSVGIIVNTLHFFVLSRRPMRAYIINALLCAMAVCDALTMTSYLIYILRFRIFDNATGVYGHIFFFTAFSVTFISIPNLLVHKIVSVNEFLGTNITQHENLYTVQLDETDISGCTLFRANLWITGIFFKAVPCALLLWFTIALIWKLCEMSEKRRLLRGDGNGNNNNNARKNAKISIDKTTLMLIIMLVVFLCTELPQGMLAVLSAIYPTHIHTMVYINVGEILDLLSLVNCLTSFVLYCCMSSTYRATVKALLMPNRRTSVQKNTLAAQSLRLLMS